MAGHCPVAHHCTCKWTMDSYYRQEHYATIEQLNV